MKIFKFGQDISYMKVVKCKKWGYAFSPRSGTYVKKINNTKSLIISQQGNELVVYTDYIKKRE